MKMVPAPMFLQHGFCPFPQPHLLTKLLIISLFILCITAMSSKDDIITCAVQPVAPFADTTLTCHFPEDLSAAKKDFTVYRYTTAASPEAIVDCWWLGENLDCYVSRGVEYNRTVSRDLTVRLQRMTSKLTGMYACQVAGYGASSLETCEFKFQLGKENSCNIDYQASDFQARLTCIFNEDIGKRKTKFAVYKYSGQLKQVVIECSWMDERPSCRVQHGYQYDDNVSAYLILGIPEVTKEKEGNYSCWHSGSENTQQKFCFLYGPDNASKEIVQSGDQSSNTLALGTSLALVLLVLAVAAGIVLLIYKRKMNTLHVNKKQSSPALEEEGVRMLDDEEEKTKKIFQEYLENEVQKMYPDMFKSCYFVPPVYFNKTRYKAQSVAGQVVYVPDPSDPHDLRHDKAMQHVLYCLHHMAQTENNGIFVLTQFQYDDYFNNVQHQHARHHLPVPNSLTDEDNSVDCFDFLIVHQVQGVLVGVVKSFSDTENLGNEIEVNEIIVLRVTEAMKQLRKADRTLRHLMSDHQLRVRLTIVFHDLNRSSLRRAVERQNALVESLRECLGTTVVDDPTELCLCSEDLSDSRTPWNVGHEVIKNIFQRWKWLSKDGESMTYYLSMVARFFGPANMSTLQVPDDYHRFEMPKTLVEAIYLTGELYERLILHPDIIKSLNEPPVFIVGPPNSGKTTMLALAGSQWLCGGQGIFLVEDASSKHLSTILRHFTALTTAQDKHSTTEAALGCIVEDQCDFKSQKSVKKCIERIITKINEKPICVLVDGAHLNGKHVKTFCEDLHAQVSDLHLWVTCSDAQYVAKGYTQLLTKVLKCPPSVVREVEKAKAGIDLSEHKCDKDLYPPATDGPLVKHFYYKTQEPGIVKAHDCVECGKEVGKFLATTLLCIETEGKDKTELANQREKVVMGSFKNTSPFKEPPSPLQFKDIVIFFEFKNQGIDVTEDHGILKGLRESGITVNVFKTKVSNVAFEGSDAAWAMHIRHLSKIKIRRKIVVYVETHSEVRDVENKRRALTSCTSQLILVHPK